jgi:hypothetical protein
MASYAASQNRYMASIYERNSAGFTASFTATLSPYANPFISVTMCAEMGYESGRQDLNLRPHGPEPVDLRRFS